MNKVIAHRGWSSRAPENTLPAIKLAMEDANIYGIEIDVQLSRDGVLVLAHDFNLERTSNGRGLVGEKDYEELSQLDFGSWFSEDFKGCKIPTLSMVLDLVDGRKALIIEIKELARRRPRLISSLLDLLKMYPYKDRVYVKSFNHGIIRDLREEKNGFKTGLLLSSRPNLLLEQISYAGADFISINYSYLNSEMLMQLIDADYGVMAWTIDSRDHIEDIKSFNKKIYIISNYPENCF